MMASITLKADIIKIVTMKSVKIKTETMMVYQEHAFGTVSSQLPYYATAYWKSYFMLTYSSSK